MTGGFDTISNLLATFAQILTWLFGTALDIVFDFIIANPIVAVTLFMAWIISLVMGVALSLFSPGR